METCRSLESLSDDKYQYTELSQDIDAWLTFVGIPEEFWDDITGVVTWEEEGELIEIWFTESNRPYSIYADYCNEDYYLQEDEPLYDYEADPEDLSMFYDPSGRSALRAGVREFPCPTCNEPDRLTKEDVRLGYQCDQCADNAEGIGMMGEY